MQRQARHLKGRTEGIMLQLVLDMKDAVSHSQEKLIWESLSDAADPAEGIFFSFFFLKHNFLS